MKVRWWQKKWIVRIENRGPRHAEFGPYRCKLTAMWVAFITPGPTEFATICRILERCQVDASYKGPPSGTVYERVDLDE